MATTASLEAWEMVQDDLSDLHKQVLSAVSELGPDTIDNILRRKGLTETIYHRRVSELILPKFEEGKKVHDGLIEYIPEGDLAYDLPAEGVWRTKKPNDGGPKYAHVPNVSGVRAIVVRVKEAQR